MAQMHRQFDATQVEPGSAMTADPEFNGWHLMHIVDSQWKAAKSNNGEFLELTVQVIGGKYNNRKLWKRLNLVNVNTQAVEIAERELSALCHALGVLRPSDSAELHNRPFMGNVVFRPATDRGGAVNEIAQNAFKPADGTAMAQPQTSRAAPTPAPAPAGTRPIWQKQPA
jgi:hypothetical protein